jgi:hypothetical protein
VKAPGDMTLDELLAAVKQLEAEGHVLPGKMCDGSPSIEAMVSWTCGQVMLSDRFNRGPQTPEEAQGYRKYFRDKAEEAVFKKIEDELCNLRTRSALLDKITAIANSAGWNGTDNSKFLDVFLQEELKELKEMREARDEIPDSTDRD